MTMSFMITMIILVHGHMVVRSKGVAANASGRRNLRVGAQEEDERYQKLDCQLPRASEIYLCKCHTDTFEGGGDSRQGHHYLQIRKGTGEHGTDYGDRRKDLVKNRDRPTSQ